MKGKLFNLLIKFLIVINFFSCSYFNNTEKPIVHTKIIKPVLLYCPKPDKPKYKKLDENKSLCSKENVSNLLYNLVQMKLYSESLELTIQCYEDQVRLYRTTDDIYKVDTSNVPNKYKYLLKPIKTGGK